MRKKQSTQDSETHHNETIKTRFTKSSCKQKTKRRVDRREFRTSLFEAMKRCRCAANSQGSDECFPPTVRNEEKEIDSRRIRMDEKLFAKRRG